MTINSNVKISKDGIVRTADGTILGAIEKIERFFGPDTWAAANRAGDSLGEFFTRRGDAVRRLIEDTEPLAVRDVELTSKAQIGFDPGFIPGLSFEPRPLLVGMVTYRGGWAAVSRYLTETQWVMDSFCPPGISMPSWSNGQGSRVTIPHFVSDEVAVLLDTEVERLGLVVTP